ncbi:MAG: short-chain dehydrogenase [Epsilonproteobacteria bacterium]|nr:MAG: short-chain dehydrogenase [Campylobacterota bacterium]RLA65303.1 MAG: short-chain dehydrogenase [Campylobacterota bacterium]
MQRKKTILITGANRGIGLALSKVLAVSGHKIIMTSRDVAKLDKKLLGISGEVVPLQMDVTNIEEIKKVVEEVKKIGPLDVIINNAGARFDSGDWHEANPQNPLLSEPDEVLKTIDVNLMGPYRVIKYFFPLLNKKDRADIINISSGMGGIVEMGPGSPGYRLSKAGLNALTANLNSTLIDTKVFVNSFCPGWVRTELGGMEATLSPEEGVQGMVWMINEEPDIRGKFLRGQTVLNF